MDDRAARRRSYASPTARADLIRGVLGPEGLVPAPRQASHNVTSLAEATHIAVVPERGEVLRKGARLAAVPLRMSYSEAGASDGSSGVAPCSLRPSAERQSFGRSRWKAESFLPWFGIA